MIQRETVVVGFAQLMNDESNIDHLRDASLPVWVTLVTPQSGVQFGHPHELWVESRPCTMYGPTRRRGPIYEFTSMHRAIISVLTLRWCGP